MMRVSVLIVAGRIASCMLLGTFAAIPASGWAQVGSAPAAIATPADRAALRARQQDLFQRLIAEPDNLDLMFEYATVSIRLEDYEPAISTLERMLIYRQDLPRVRLELGVAYFNLGSYTVAEHYFRQVLDDPAAPEPVRQRVQRYLTEIAQRTRKHAYSVVLTVGPTYSTNATLGPVTDQVLLLGNLATLTQGQEEDDFGIRSLVTATHAYDLQQPDDDYWKTDFSFFSLSYFDTDAGDVYFGRARTGPRLSLTPEQYGPKVRPYLEAQYLNASNRGLFAGFGAGAEYTDTLSPVYGVFADAGFRYRNYFRQEFSDEDVFNIYSLGGLAYSPNRDLVLRGTGIFEIDNADADFNSNVEFGLRVSGDYLYDPGIEWIDQKWLLSTFSEVRHRMFEANDPVIGADCCRRDWDLRSGITHLFALKNGFGMQLDVEALMRDSNIRNFDVNAISATVSLRYQL